MFRSVTAVSSIFRYQALTLWGRYASRHCEHILLSALRNAHYHADALLATNQLHLTFRDILFYLILGEYPAPILLTLGVSTAEFGNIDSHDGNATLLFLSLLHLSGFMDMAALLLPTFVTVMTPAPVVLCKKNRVRADFHQERTHQSKLFGL